MPNTTSASLKLTVQATGENSGTWGTFTNTNLLILEQAIGGYDAVGVTSGATLTFSNGVLSNGKNQVLKLTGTITGNVNVTIPDSIEKTYIVDNATTGAFTVTFKTTSGTGVTWGTTDKGTKLVYSDGTNVVDSGLVSTVLNSNLDINGNNIVSTSNTNIDIIPDGTGRVRLVSDAVRIGDSNVDATLTTNGTGDLILNTNNGTNAGDITLADGANGDISFTTNGTGKVKFNNAAYNPEATLTDGATINWAVNSQPVAKVTLGGNRTLAAPTGSVTGQFVSLLIIQDGTGSRTLTFNAVYEFASDTAPTLTSAGNKGDLFVFRYNGTKWLEVGRNLNLTLS
tara:strand:+ start:1903 stop:2925 length:1023 start_codon:yes stop_codon:yes gene_type:complete